MTKSKGVYRKSPYEPKKCTLCGERKSPSEFYGSGFRLSATCKACRAEVASGDRKLWRKKQSPESRERSRAGGRKRGLYQKRQRSMDRRERKKLAIKLITDLHNAGFSNGDIARRGNLSRIMIGKWMRMETSIQNSSLKKLRLVWRAWQDGEISPFVRRYKRRITVDEIEELNMLREVAKAAITIVAEAKPTNDWHDEFTIQRRDRNRLWNALATWRKAFPPQEEKPES